MMRMTAAASTKRRLRRLAETRTLNMGLPHLVQQACALGHHPQVDRKSGQHDHVLAVQRLIPDGARRKALRFSLYPDREQTALRSNDAGGGQHYTDSLLSRLQDDSDRPADVEICRDLRDAEAQWRCLLLQC